MATHVLAQGGDGAMAAAGASLALRVGWRWRVEPHPHRRWRRRVQCRVEALVEEGPQGWGRSPPRLPRAPQGPQGGALTCRPDRR